MEGVVDVRPESRDEGLKELEGVLGDPYACLLQGLHVVSVFVPIESREGCRQCGMATTWHRRTR